MALLLIDAEARLENHSRKMADRDGLLDEIKLQGETVRKLKAEKAPKEQVSFSGLYSIVRWPLCVESSGRCQ